MPAGECGLREIVDALPDDFSEGVVGDVPLPGNKPDFPEDRVLQGPDVGFISAVFALGRRGHWEAIQVECMGAGGMVCPSIVGCASMVRHGFKHNLRKR